MKAQSETITVLVMDNGIKIQLQELPTGELRLQVGPGFRMSPRAHGQSVPNTEVLVIKIITGTFTDGEAEGTK